MVDSINIAGPKGFTPVKNEPAERKERQTAEARVQELQQSSDTVEISDDARIAQAQDTARQARSQIENTGASLSGGRIDTFA